MSRENAIKFLRDIRLGIEYLQNSYANHDFSNKNKDNEVNFIWKILSISFWDLKIFSAFKNPFKFTCTYFSEISKVKQQ